MDSAKLSQVRYLGLTFVGLLIPFSLYYIFYVTHQEKYFSERNYRVLGLMSQQLGGRIEALCGAVQSATRAVPGDGSSSADAIRNAILAIRDEGGPVTLVHDRVDVAPSAPPANGRRLTLHSQSIQDGGRTILLLEFSGYRGPTDAGPEPSDRWEAYSFVIRMGLDDLAGPFVAPQVTAAFASQAPFDCVFIEQRGTGEKPPTTLLYDHAPAGVAAGYVALQEASKSDDAEAAPVTTTLNGTQYRVFRQPVAIRLARVGMADDASTDNWSIYGLVSEQHFLSQTLAISYTVLALYVFVGLLVATSWPLLKLRFMGRFERLRTADVYQAAFALMIGSALLTLLWLDSYAYATLEAKLDDSLEHLAGDVGTNFDGEMLAAARELNRLDSNYAASPRSEIGMLSKPDFLRESFYPDFVTAFWCRADGWQQAKWNMRRRATAPTSLADRDYFRTVTDGDGWRYYPVGGGGLSESGYAVERVFAKTTGESEVILAKRSQAAGTTTTSAVVAALDTKLLSLMDPVLPTGFGFCVVDGDGKVVVHSESEKSGWEDFFDECDRNDHLEAIVRARSSDWFNARYHGNDFRMFATALKGTPWSLVTFRDKRNLRAVNIEVLLLSLIAFFVYSVAVLVLVGSVHGLDVREHGRWVWPDESRRRDYLMAIAVNVGSALACTAMAIRAAPVDGVAWTVTFTISALLANVIIFKLAPIRAALGTAPSCPRPRKSLSTRYYYLGALTSLLVLTAVVPTATFFRASYDSEMRIFVKHGQVSLARSMEKREGAIRRRIASYLDPNDTTRYDTFVRRRLAATSDVHANVLFGTTIATPAAASPEASAGTLWNTFLGLAPIFDQASLEMNGLRSDRSSDGRWVWSAGADGQPLRLDSAKALGSMSVALSTPLPSLELVQPSFWCIGFVALPLVLLAGTVFVSRRLFFLGIDEPVVVYDSSNVDRNPSSNRLVIGKRSSSGMQVNGAPCLDFAACIEKADWDALFARVPSSRRRAVVVMNFDAHHGANCETEKLSFMQRLRRAGNPMLVLSQADPRSSHVSSTKTEMVRVTTPGGAAAAPALAPDENVWADYFQDFLVFRAGDFANSDSFLRDARWNRFGHRAGQTGHGRAPCEQPICRCLRPCNTRWLFGKLMKRRGLVRLRRWYLLVAMWRRVELRRAFARECRGRAQLHDIARSYLETYGTGLAESDYEVMMHRLTVHTESYYRHIWSALSPEERLTVFRVAEDRFLSVRNPYAVRLLRLGLLKFDPNLQLMNETFRRFALRLFRPEDADRYDKKEDGLWHVWKVPFMTVLVAVGAFLVVTQREFYDWTVSTMTALAAGIPVALRLIDAYLRGGAEPPPKV